MKTYKGNTEKVMAEAADIARRFEGMEVGIESLMKEYHCGYPAMLKAVLSQMSERRYKQICKKRRALTRPGENTGFKKGHATWNKGMKGLHFPGSEVTWF